MPEPVELCRRSGESVFVEHASARYTTLRLLDAEERIVTAARQTSRPPAIGPDLIDQAIAGSTRRLSGEQVGMARAFTGSDRFLLLGLAPAGAGKTTTMRVVVQAWRAAGRPVVALAPSAVAADVLRTELGTDADTLAKFDHDQPAIAPGTLILVDEAGMAGTLMLDRLIGRAKRAGAVVRLLGDDQQLGAVEAGGVIRHLADRGRRGPDAAGRPLHRPRRSHRHPAGPRRRPGRDRLLPHPQPGHRGHRGDRPRCRLRGMAGGCPGRAGRPVARLLRHRRRRA